jgi:uncharacterized membrane protein
MNEGYQVGGTEKGKVGDAVHHGWASVSDGVWFCMASPCTLIRSLLLTGTTKATLLTEVDRADETSANTTAYTNTCASTYTRRVSGSHDSGQQASFSNGRKPPSCCVLWQPVRLLCQTNHH